MKQEIKTGTKVTSWLLGNDIYMVRFISPDGLTAELSQPGRKGWVSVPSESLTPAGSRVNGPHQRVESMNQKNNQF